MSDYKDEFNEETTDQEATAADAELSDDQLEDVAGGVADWNDGENGNEWNPDEWSPEW